MDLQLNPINNNLDNQFQGDTPYSSNQPKFIQNPQNPPPQPIPQYQYPLQPIYTQQTQQTNIFLKSSN